MYPHFIIQESETMWIRQFLGLIAFFFVVLLAAAMPELIRIAKNSPQNLPWEPPVPPISRTEQLRMLLADEVTAYVKGIPNGEFLMYQRFSSTTGRMEKRPLLEDLGAPFAYSAGNLAGAGVLALLAGTAAGLLLARSGGWIRDGLEFLVTVPDFAAAFFLQLLVVFIYKQTDVLLASVFTIEGDPAYLLPFVTLFYLPFVYVVKLVSSQAWQVLTEDYILTAKAKGLSKRQIYVRHVLRNVLPVIQGDLYRLSAIMVGNMVVIENLFNSPGVITFLFPRGSIDFYADRVNLIWILLSIFLLTYGILRLTVFGLKRGLAHD
jgi:peptide/nickel transport system permease protein